MNSRDIRKIGKNEEYVLSRTTLYTWLDCWAVILDGDRCRPADKISDSANIGTPSNNASVKGQRAFLKSAAVDRGE